MNKKLNVEVYHGGLSYNDRTLLFNKWLSNEIPVLISTIALGLGINKSDVRFVIHY